MGTGGGSPGDQDTFAGPGKGSEQTSGSEPAHCRVLPSLQAKKGVYIFKWLGRKRTVFRDMWKIYAIHVSFFTNTRWCTAPRSFTDHQRGTMRAEVRTRDRTVWPTGPEISTAWPSTENVCPPLL